MSSPTLAGDWKDDDGAVIDSFLDENTDGAKNPPPTTDAFVPNTDKPRPTTILNGTEITMLSGVVNGAGLITTPSSVPVMVLPPDPDRIGVHIHVNALGANLIAAGLGSDVLRFSHDPGRLFSKMGCGAVVTSQPVDGMAHTGALWIFAPEVNNLGAGGGMQVWVWGITK